ncbi:MAG TPA: undecaprenyl-phosphate glucose phosphotransferase, partial [Aeromonadales bacterium]|nr:undecaprenyl-phosphate glucose phosphotransferase [Aeromonadales bacterium]
LGANKVGNDIARKMQEDISLGYNFIGFFDDRTEADERIPKELVGSIKGSFDDVIKSACTRQIDVLYIALPLAAEQRIITLLDELSDSAIAVHIIPNFFIYNILHARWHNIGPYQALSIYDTPFYGAGSLVKKAEDMIVASIIVALTSLPMLLIAIAIKLTSPGPVIFKQKRYGINGKELMVYKFRSMTSCDNGDVIKQAEKNDSRITKVGAFLRKTSLDELPQFFNVLDGSMSVVGPRPHAVAHNEEYRHQVGSYMLRHLVKPGITGWAQINGYRGETKTIEQMEKRIEYDLYYIRNWSLTWDIKIIIMTVFKGFVNKNAY